MRTALVIVPPPRLDLGAGVHGLIDIARRQGVAPPIRPGQGRAVRGGVIGVGEGAPGGRLAERPAQGVIGPAHPRPRDTPGGLRQDAVEEIVGPVDRLARPAREHLGRHAAQRVIGHGHGLPRSQPLQGQVAVGVIGEALIIARVRGPGPGRGERDADDWQTYPY